MRVSREPCQENVILYWDNGKEYGNYYIIIKYILC